MAELLKAYDDQDRQVLLREPAYADNNSKTGASVGKPLYSFDTQEDGDGEDSDLEDGLDSRRTSLNSRRTRKTDTWWQTMVVCARRKISLDDMKDGLHQALSQDSLSKARRQRRKRSWLNCYIFGGVSGLTILYVSCIPSERCAD